MDVASLLQLVRDAAGGAHSSHPSENDLVQQLESVRKRLQCLGSAEIGPEVSAIAVCHVTTQVVAFLVQYGPITAQTASVKWQKRVFLLETAVASSFVGIGCAGSEEGGVFELEMEDRRDFCYVYKMLLQRLWEMAGTPQQAVGVISMLTKLCVLLACCWLSYDRVGKLLKVEELLKVCSDFCLKHEETKRFSKWPLFLRGMIEIVEKKDSARAVECFREAVVSCVDDEREGVIYYWYAVALIRNEQAADAIAALDQSIRVNYEPVACLSLQALVNVQAQDFHAASEQLQRSLEINTSLSGSLFNYALVLERMNNFEGQQHLLEYILETRADGSGADQKKTTQGVAPGSSSAEEVSPCIFPKSCLMPLFPSQLTNVDPPAVYLHLARAAMDNGSWHESKMHFEKYLSFKDLHVSRSVVAETARNYVYVLLQCKLPTLALRICEQYLVELGQRAAIVEADVVVSLLFLHLYKADAQLCLEHVDECYKYLNQISQPKMQDAMRQINKSSVSMSVREEIMSCHTLLLNNLAVATACRNGVDTAISLLQDGLQQYPNCLAIKFNLVLLLWRKGDESVACSIWSKARGWKLQASTREIELEGETGGTNPLLFTPASSLQSSSISEHVQDNVDGEGGVSTQQLVYLDELILNYWRKTQNAKLADKTLQYVEYIESQGTTNIPHRDQLGA